MAERISFKNYEWKNMALALIWYVALTAKNINALIQSFDTVNVHAFKVSPQDLCGEGGLQHICCTVPCFGCGTQLQLFLDELSQLFLQGHIFTMHLFNKRMLQKMGD